MAKMVDLKLSPAEAKEETVEAQEKKGPEYPWGTRLCLDAEAMKKLGLTGEAAADMIKGKAKLVITAEAQMCGMSMSKYSDGTEYESCDIQLTSMSVDQAPEKDKDTSLSAKMYGEEAKSKPPAPAIAARPR